MEPFAAIRDARDRELVVNFLYPSSRAPRPVARTFSPFQVDNDSVLGWDHGRDEVRRYRYDRMTQIEFNPDAEYVRPT